ncbi:metal ABC transporter substrate-binding protein [Treponema sp.]|uniref:metal ABC transporter substrate-binding protein n=1 Tax=Treponema sp. TaxID=166 RepID=UPI003F0EB13C
MKDKNSLKPTLVFTVCFFVFVIAFFSVWKNSLDSKSREDSSQNEKLKITASFYPIYIMLLNLTDGMDNVELSLLAPSETGCLHDYQLTTRDMKLIEKCDILVVNGSGMEDFIEKAFSMKKNSLVVASQGFELFDENPHVWVSIQGAVYEVEKITEGLCSLDSQNAEIYRKNSLAYIEKLKKLEEKMHLSLDKFAGKKIITFHEAFPYFAKEFGFEISAVIEQEPGTAPSSRELSQIIETVKNSLASDGNAVLFAEPQYSSSAAEIIARETGLSVYELDPCVNGEISKNAYIDCMEKNLQVLISAFSQEKN